MITNLFVVHLFIHSVLVLVGREKSATHLGHVSRLTPTEPAWNPSRGGTSPSPFSGSLIGKGGLLVISQFYFIPYCLEMARQYVDSERVPVQLTLSEWSGEGGTRPGSGAQFFLKSSKYTLKSPLNISLTHPLVSYPLFGSLGWCLSDVPSLSYFRKVYKTLRQGLSVTLPGADHYLSSTHSTAERTLTLALASACRERFLHTGLSFPQHVDALRCHD